MNNQSGWDKLQQEATKLTATPLPKNGDPGVHPTDVAYDRMKQLVGTVTTSCLKELTELRDQLDSLMIAIRERDTSLIQQITNHTDFCSGAMQTKQVISDSIKRIQNDFKQTVTTIEANNDGQEIG